MRSLNHPKPGYYKVRGAKRGVYRLWIPARIFRHQSIDPLTGEKLDRPMPLIASIDGREVPLDWVWISGREITKEEHEWLTAIHKLRK